MPKTAQTIRDVPTNIITGFLGVGKTSAILELLKRKPANEHWAVLINEFGEIGVDGHQVKGNHSQNTGVFIKEVPGGCMCCAAGLPMQFALNELLTTAKSDRLLIEPTGLGHPKEVLGVLSAQHYQGVLDIHNILTLVDARKLAESRYTSHPTFKQQLEIADVVVGNKTDLYEPTDRQALIEYVNQHLSAQTELVFTEHGTIDPALLNAPTRYKSDTEQSHHDHDHDHDHQHTSSVQLKSIESNLTAVEGITRAENSGESFYSLGWQLSAKHILNSYKVRHWLDSQDALRVKAVVITEKGIFSYNRIDRQVTITELDESPDSRIEMIQESEFKIAIEQGLLACIDTLDNGKSDDC